MECLTECKSLCLRGYDALFVDDNPSMQPGDEELNNARKEEYKENAVYVVICLLHLLSVAINFKNPTLVPFSDYKAMLQLAVKTSRAARLNCEDIYGYKSQVPGRRRQKHSRLLERARRAWWVLMLMDRHLAIMFDTEPEIKLEECAEIGLHISDGAYEHIKRMQEIAEAGEKQSSPGSVDSGSAGSVASAGTPASAAPPKPTPPPPPPAASSSASPKQDLSHLYPFSNSSNEMMAYLVSRSNSGNISRGTVPEFPLPIAPPPVYELAHLRSSIGPEGMFSPTASYIRIFILFERIMNYRRNHSQPYLNSPDRTEILSEMDRWFQELPDALRTMDTTVLRKPEIGLPSQVGVQDEKNAIGMIAWVLLPLGLSWFRFDFVCADGSRADM